MKKTLPIIILLLGLIISLASLAHAQTASILSVAPSRQELTIDPGETTSVSLKFLNRGETPIAGNVGAVDFIVEDDEGSPTFLDTPAITGTTQILPRFSAASWITLPYKRITIAAKDQVTVDAKIAAPADARPGGRYLALYFEPSGSLEEAVGVSHEAASPVAVRIAGLVYIRVAGPITEEAQVVQFKAPRFLEYGPVPITTEILNRGDYHLRPQGKITLTNIFGQPVAEEALKEVNIFPDASRVLENKIGQKLMLGKYKAELTATYGEEGKTLTATLFFWVFPWKITSTIILAIIIIIILLATFYRRLKGHQEALEAKLAEEEQELEELKEKLEKKGQ
jgi:hypothetical protein